MTIRLFDTDPALRVFTARVTSCEPQKEQWAIVLDQTAFFPEGGGQMADRGTLNDQQVLDVKETLGIIRHIVAEPIPVGTEVSGKVDSLHRLDMMQQHSGEHVLSGLTCRLHHCDNVGFHIGPDEVTVDFNVPLTAEQVEELELLANQAIWKNIPIKAWFPDAETLAAMSYRSKKELTGAVRIVEIEGIDTCACCGTHVPSTGAIGQIKVTDCRNYKGGVRLTLKCGMRALKEANLRQHECRDISHALNSRLGELLAAVQRLMSERDTLKASSEAMALTCFRQQAAAETGAVRVIFSDTLPAGMMRKAAAELAEGAKCAAVLTPRGEGWNLALCSLCDDIRPVAQKLIQRFGGKAGGPKDMVQGVLNGGTADDIRSEMMAE